MSTNRRYCDHCGEYVSRTTYKCHQREMARKDRMDGVLVCDSTSDSEVKRQLYSTIQIDSFVYEGY